AAPSVEGSLTACSTLNGSGASIEMARSIARNIRRSFIEPAQGLMDFSDHQSKIIWTGEVMMIGSTGPALSSSPSVFSSLLSPTSNSHLCAVSNSTFSDPLPLGAQMQNLLLIGFPSNHPSDSGHNRSASSSRPQQAKNCPGLVTSTLTRIVGSGFV